MTSSVRRWGWRPEVEQLGVGGVEVVLLVLDPRVGQALRDVDPVRADTLDHLRHVAHGEGLGELVEDSELAALGRVLERQGDAGEGVADVEHAAGLAAGAVDGQRVAR